MKSFRTFDLDRPANVPREWPVYNAPRPLPGTATWESDWRRGRHFAAIDPVDERKDEMLRDIEALDGWQVVEVVPADFMAWIAERCREYDYDGDLEPLMDGFRSQYLREGWGK
jgi:hypothetical protein